MAKLRISTIADNKPVKITIELPAAIFRDLGTYAEVLRRETQQAVEPASLIPPMLEKFMASDHAFRKMRRQHGAQSVAPGQIAAESKSG